MLRFLLLVCMFQCSLALEWSASEQQLRNKLAKRAASPFSLDWDNTIAICAIMRQEKTEDVREWLQYHRYIGVDQVLLYDNNENGGKQAAELVDFIQDGFLTFYTVPGQAMQIPVYQHCLLHSSEKYTWLAAIDIDEFLFVEDEQARTMPAALSLKSVLRDFRFYPALFLQWKGFGPGNHHERPEPGGPLEHYKQCMPLTWPPPNKERLTEQGLPDDAGQAVDIVKYGKSIVNRFWTSHASTAHGFMYWGGQMPVTDAYQRVKPALAHDQSRVDHAQIAFTQDIKYRNKRLVVHHYATRSYADYQTKLARGAGDHTRDNHLRGMGFFEALNASTIEHPSCESALEIAKQCCRDEAGQPWPPVPPHNTMTSFLTGAPSYQVHALSHADVPSLEDINVNKGHMFRPGHHAPFPNTWKASAVICARWDRSTDESALHEWLDHHRHIGVKEIQLYVLDSEPKPQDEELKNYSKAFLHWRSLSGQRPNEDEATFVRRKCIEENSQDTAFITFLHTYDYIMPRGRNKNDRKQLLKILETREFRFGAGVVLPVFEFGKFDMGAVDQEPQLYPLRHFKDCTYFGHHLMTRTIANTYYIDEPVGDTDYTFVYGMLPITDSRTPWVPQLIDIPTNDERRIFPPNIEYNGSALDYQLKRFHLTKPFGSTLAVFSFPPERTVPMPGEAWRHRLRHFITTLHSSDSSCSEAAEAADTCCRWEVPEELHKLRSA